MRLARRRREVGQERLRLPGVKTERWARIELRLKSAKKGQSQARHRCRPFEPCLRVDETRRSGEAIWRVLDGPTDESCTPRRVQGQYTGGVLRTRSRTAMRGGNDMHGSDVATEKGHIENPDRRRMMAR